MNAQQTRGPWKVLENGRGNGRICVTTANGAPIQAVICEIDVKSFGTDYLVRLHNAHLIASAPDLLAALEVCADLLASIKNDTACEVAANHARAAILKAKGIK